jgi:pantoate--beta-alanine ligase
VTEVIRETRAMRAWSAEQRAAGRRIGFVPTMGALHEGHLDLVRRARASCDVVVASIFVNPTQFAPGEDFDAYPRTFETDHAQLAALGVEMIFAPTVDAMYPLGAEETWVEVPLLARAWCGISRPTFFRGVATVVTKLLAAVAPDEAFFGRKDWQQLAVVRRLAIELLLPVTIVGVATRREPDGLAMSSRNVYLTPAERAAAPGIYAALTATRADFAAGQRDAAVLTRVLHERLAAIPGAVTDYAGIADPASLLPLAEGTLHDGQLMVAVRFGRARLIDNLALAPEVRGET